MSNRNPTILNNVNRSARHALTGLVLFGGTVGTTAIMASGCTANEEPVQVSEAPAWKQSFAPVPKAIEVAQDTAKPVVIEETAKPVSEPKVELAIAHDEEGDLAAEALILMDDGKLTKALTALRKHAYTDEPTADDLLLMGRLARKVSKLKVAEAALEEGIALDAKRSDLAVELARVHLDARRPRKAEKAARRALRADRDDAAAWNQLGRAAMARSRWETAELAFKRAVYLDPVDGLIQNNIGLLYVYMKRGPDAVEALERAVELMEDDTPYFVLNNLGLAHELAGQNEEAREAFEEALLLNPFYTRAKVNLDRVAARIEAAQESDAFKTAKGVEAAESPALSPDDA